MLESLAGSWDVYLSFSFLYQYRLISEVESVWKISAYEILAKKIIWNSPSYYCFIQRRQIWTEGRTVTHIHYTDFDLQLSRKRFLGYVSEDIMVLKTRGLIHLQTNISLHWWVSVKKGTTLWNMHVCTSLDVLLSDFRRICHDRHPQAG